LFQSPWQVESSKLSLCFIIDRRVSESIGEMSVMDCMKTSSELRRILPSVKGQGGSWRVKVMRSGQTYNARFADANYQNPEIARSAAQEFLDALLKRLPAPRKLCRTGRDGLPGSVTRIAGQNPVWTAMLSVVGKKLRKCFSISRYGEDEARGLAQGARAEWLSKHGFDQLPSLPSEQEVLLLANTIRRRFGEQPRKKGRERKFNEESMYGISRREADADGNGGYWVAALVRQGETYRKQFGDGAYGSSEAAFAAATKYRNEIFSNVEAMPRRERHEMLCSRNTSGVAGVYMKRVRGQLVAWGATIMVQGKLHRRSFSIKQCGGAEQAYELAVQARKAMLEMVEGDCTTSPAVQALSAKKSRPIFAAKDPIAIDGFSAKPKHLNVSAIVEAPGLGSRRRTARSLPQISSQG
jgi:hypothetical protein